MATVKLLFSCKKLRRSTRLEMKEKVESKCKSIKDGPLGYFEIIPLELKFVVFSYLPVEELSILTIVSKQMRNIVELYKNSSFAQKFLLPKAITHSSIPPSEQEYFAAKFEKLGILMKRSTCLYATKDRLRLMQQYLQKYLCRFHQDCQDPNNCIALVCYGKFLHTVIAGWDDKECAKTFETIGNNTLMLRNLDSIVKYKAGAYPSLELHARLFFRRVFLYQCSTSYDKAFWLSLILKPYPMVHQARVLFLLFGPMSRDEVQWYEMCESTPVNKEQSLVCFGDLANAFRVLHHCCKDWSEDDIISVIDEVTSSPDEWLSENVANLLFLCGDNITLKVLNSKAINGRVTELASIITSLCLVCIRHEQPISWVVTTISGVCSVLENTRDKIGLLYGIVDMFKEVITDLHEFSDAAGDEDNGHELQSMLDAQAEFTREIIIMAFKGMLISPNTTTAAS